MKNSPTNLSKEVSDFLNDQNHPLREEIEILRQCILETNTGLIENIKWNGPNYSFNKQDRITLKINPPKQLQLIFHRGAKKLEQPPNKLIETTSKLLVWKENDRAVISFKNRKHIEDSKKELSGLVADWINILK